MQRSELDGLPPLGEADVKFTRYADLYQRLMVDSIDGDSVPIALLHHERCAGVSRFAGSADDARARRVHR